VPYHHSQPSYSGRVVEVDLDTTKYNSIRIHNVFTDLADYYSEGGVGPYERSLDNENPEPQVTEHFRWPKCFAQVTLFTTR